MSPNSIVSVRYVITGSWAEYVPLCTNDNGILRCYDFLSLKLMIESMVCFFTVALFLFIFHPKESY